VDPNRWKEVSRIAADCMELDDARRREHLDRTCGDDHALRVEVERILAAHEGHDPLLDEGTVTQSGSITPGLRRGSTITPPSRSTPTFATDKLPTELMERSARRLSTVAMLYAVGFPIIYAVRELTIHVFAEEPYDQSVHMPGQFIIAAFTVIALWVAWVTSRQRLEGRRFFAVAAGFEVVGTLGIALASYSNLSGAALWGVTWPCMWIVVFPFVIPMSPRAAAIGSFTSAAMGPVAVLAWAFAMHDPPTRSTMLASTVPNFVVAALAYLGAHEVYQVGVALEAAKRLGRYRLVKPLGHGGMGEIWVAEHDLLARPAALKLIRPTLLKHGGPSPAILERFEREAQATASLTSPHTVKLYDFGVTEDGLLYYVMELLDGMDLEVLVERNGPLPAARAVHFLRQACASLAEAHSLGLIHRDIKPSNLFACRQGLERDFLKVLDFGIVRATTSPGEARPDGAGVEGTPAFMAPEARHGVASPATDLYSLGCVAYWLVTGHHLRDRDGRAGRTSIETGLAFLEDEPPTAFNSIVMACLERDPSRRPQSAAELDALLAAVPVPVWDQGLAGAWWKDRETAAPSTPVSRLSS